MIRLIAPVLCAGLCFHATAQSENPLTQVFLNRYEDLRLNLIESAELMSGRDYGFRPAPAQRRFREWIRDTSISNYLLCSSIQGTLPPDTRRLHGLKGKKELVRALRASFAYCDAALECMDDRKALTSVMIGTRKAYPVQAMVSLIAAGNQHYGKVSGYLRMKGLVPPSVARGEVRVPTPPEPAPPPVVK